MTAIFDFDTVEVQDSLPVDLLVIGKYDSESLSDLKSIDENSASPVINVVSYDLDISVQFSDNSSQVKRLSNWVSIRVLEGLGDCCFISGSIVPIREFGGQSKNVSVDRLDNGLVVLAGLS